MDLEIGQEGLCFVNDAPVQIADYLAFLVRPLLILATMITVGNHFGSVLLTTSFNVQIFSGMHTLKVEIYFLFS
jgi:hypothetical protein